jgi:uncharacterized protein YcsI (UPF0317 family)
VRSVPTFDMPRPLGSGSTQAAQARQRIRRAEWAGHTSGLADEHVQGNVVILPAQWAADFLLFCQRNPKPCPLLAVLAPGEAMLPTLGHDIDIVPMCHATAYGVMANWWPSPPTLLSCGLRTW